MNKMKFEYYDNFIRKTKGRSDLIPLFENNSAFSNLLKDLIKPFNKTEFNKILGLESLGFIIAGALSQKTKKDLIIMRKRDKIPGLKKDILITNFIDYTNKNKGFEINKNSIEKNDKVLIVDEWIETGTQIKNAIKLIEKLEAKVIGISVLCAHKNKNTEILFKKYNLNAIRIINEL
jgi:adenine phosphoribosyltransferase